VFLHHQRAVAQPRRYFPVAVFKDGAISLKLGCKSWPSLAMNSGWLCS